MTEAALFQPRPARTPAAPGVSFIICSYNRRALLQKLVDSILIQPRAGYPHEIIIVDNNSKDDTGVYAKALAERDPRFVYVFEAQQGLSHARNAGAVVAREDFLLYLDDDAVLPPHYLGSLGALLAEHRPDFFGGPVYPDYVDPRPAWFPESLEIRKKAEVSGFDNTINLSGGNLGVRREVLARLGGFDPDYGMRGKSVGMLDERLVIEAYRRTVPARDQKVYYSLDHFILHRTTRARMTAKFQVRRVFIANYQLIRFCLSQGVRNPQLVLDQIARMFWRNLSLVLKGLPYIWRQRRAEPERPMRTLMKMVHRSADFLGALSFQVFDSGRARRARRLQAPEARPLRITYFAGGEPAGSPREIAEATAELRDSFGDGAVITVVSIADKINENIHQLVAELNLRAEDAIIVDTPKAALALGVIRPSTPHIQMILWLKEMKHLSYLFDWPLIWRKRGEIVRRIWRDRESARAADQVVCSLPRQARRSVRLLIPMRDWRLIPRMPPLPAKPLSELKMRRIEATRAEAAQGWRRVLDDVRAWSPRRLEP